jgi:hypothetical protein
VFAGEDRDIHYIIMPLLTLLTSHPYTRMQGTKASQHAGSFNCFKEIVTNEGFARLYAGVILCLSQVVPGQRIIFMSFV